VIVVADYHLHVQILSRGAGRSCVAAAAYRAADKLCHHAVAFASYRSGNKLQEQESGIRHDYRRKGGVVHTEIILPYNAPNEFKSRNMLWNAVEYAEKRKDAQIAREIDIALPVEFDRREQIDLMREYVKDNFIDKGMCADLAIHDKRDGNPHAHIMLTTRDVSEDGFGKKNRDWNKVEHLEAWRENWAQLCNTKFREKGLDIRIDHRTLKAQGIDREPTIHVGRSPERARQNEEIKKRNKLREISKTPEFIAGRMHELKKKYVALDREISAQQQQATAIQQEMRVLMYKAKGIVERVEQIRNMGVRLQELKQQRQGMGFFESKKAIDIQIQSAQQSYEQARAFFNQQYDMEPSEVAIDVLEDKAKDKKKAYERLQAHITPLVADRERILLEYQRQKSFVDISEDKQEIKECLKQLEPQNITPRERLARLQCERTLESVTEKNFRAILEKATPQQRQRLIAERDRAIEFERMRERNRARGRDRVR